jgi:hypothetical protein
MGTRGRADGTGATRAGRRDRSRPAGPGATGVVQTGQEQASRTRGNRGRSDGTGGRNKGSRAGQRELGHASRNKWANRGDRQV